MDSDKSMKIIISILIIAVISQAYILYGLNQTIKSAAGSEVKEEKIELPSSDNSSMNDMNENHLSPLREFKIMQKEFDKIFSSFNTHFDDDKFFNDSFNDGFFHKPLLDMTQNDSEYLIKMDIPGVKNNNIKTSVEDGILTIKAEVDETKESNTSSLIKKERYINKFQRSVTLPDNADISKMRTDYKNGVLSITVPKL